MRTVFGVQESERLERLGDALRDLLAFASQPARMASLAVLGPRRVAELGLVRSVLEPTDELIYEEIRARRGAPDLAERDDVLSLLLQARHDDGTEMSDEELRDELMTLLVAGHETSATALAWALDALTPPSARARAPARRDRRRRGRLPGRGRQGDAPAPPGHRPRAPPPDRADGDRRPHAARRRERGALHLPAAPARRTSTTSRARSVPSASSRSRRAPTPGSRSAAACAAASAPASPSSR